MPRKPRQESSTEFYHITSRGINKFPIFSKNLERSRFLNIIRDSISQYNIKIFAYCVMSNHFHLLMRAPIEELSAFMARILSVYAVYYNQKHNRVGYVFDGRFRSQCIEDESYFFNCLRYIHLNPIKANMCKSIDNYRYSSFKEFISPPHSGIIHPIAFEIIDKHFESIEHFKSFHTFSTDKVFIDLPEDELLQRKAIATTLLYNMHRDLDIPVIEILDNIPSRKMYDTLIKDFFNISMHQAENIRKLIKTELKQKETD
ncbi:transposase [Faecalicatena contorta]|uniref:transposase n=1 Tax=Faecalicatena contorta TaxID=39482 RepID=UPI001F2D110A|nr:transposase [Faecalicatena contorta]MCF2684177.1 transposase [Faecalicatena contorta]